ncbi:MAG: zf-HC2 domain-containing protein [Gammaproteobacteria bacterium]|nr:MAG: zf-HC2 domain-containing protein [Gammaproteobacteria bacterium]
MMNCKQATKLMSQEQDRDLSLSERVRLRLHLFICTGCTNYNKQLKVIHQAMKRLGDHKSGN